MGLKKRKRVANANNSARSSDSKGDIAHMEDGSEAIEQAVPGPEEECILDLRQEQWALFVGRGAMTVERGAVELSGFRLQASSDPLLLAADASLPIAIRAEPPDPRIPLSPLGGSRVRIKSVRDEFDGQSSVDNTFQTLIDDHSTGIDVSLPPIWAQAAEDIVANSSSPVTTHPFPPVIAICGGKKVGKSTFARYLVNKLLNTHPSVAHLETDCGQPEFTPPGLVSLTVLDAPVLGAPHMHHTEPIAAHFLGTTTPSSDPERYLESVKSLVSRYLRLCGGKEKSTAHAPGSTHAAPRYAGMPLVVNTHGWIRGFGLEILSETLRYLPITHYVHVRAPVVNKDLPPGLFWKREFRDAMDIGGESRSACSAYSSAIEAAVPSIKPSRKVYEIADVPPLHFLVPWIGIDSVSGNNNEVGAPSERREPPRMVVDEKTSEAVSSGRMASWQDANVLLSQKSSVPSLHVSATEQRALHWIRFAHSCYVNSRDGMSISTSKLMTSSFRGSGGIDQLPWDAATDPHGASKDARLEVGDRLAAAIPFQINLEDVSISFLNGEYPEQGIGIALNSCIVGLCKRQKKTRRRNGSAKDLALCLGLGIVRTFDGESRRLLVLTNLDEAKLEEVDLLEIGSLELPQSLLQTENFMSPYLTLHSLTATGTAAAAMKSRNNLLRLGQII